MPSRGTRVRALLTAPGHRRTRWIVGAVVVVVSLAVIVSSQAWTGSSGPTARAGTDPTPTATTPPIPSPAQAGPPALTLAPTTGSGGVSVLAPVTATAHAATLDAVTLVGPGGRQVAGAFDAEHRGWHNTEPLAYNTAYTLSATALGGDQKLQQTSTFRTVKPANLTMAYLRANTGLLLSSRQVYGVGQPIVVYFDENIPDRALAQQSLEVVTSPPVDGAWHWFNGHELHWRPKTYWPSGTKVTVVSHIYGRTFGNGLYGQADSSASFTIGASRIAIADDKTFHMQVFVNGSMVRDIPVAMGLHSSLQSSNGMWIDLRTHSGVHVVLGHDYVVQMNSASFGLTGPGSYNEPVYWTTHLSYSGEYVHSAPWSVGQQGHSDASHGCLNVNPDNAVWFYNNFIPGDIVEVRNTGLQLDPTDGLGDWTLSWDSWIKGSALPYQPPSNRQIPD